MFKHRTNGYEKKDKNGNPTGKYTNALRKRLSREQKRIKELNTLIKKIYEDNVNGKLSDKRFEMLSVDPAPDTLLRVFMAWKSVGEAVEIPAQNLSAPERIGFTVVEWGGCQVR